MARFDPDEFSETDDMFAVSMTPDEASINSMMLNGHSLECTAKSVTTVVEIRGLSRSQAIGYTKNADYNFKDKKTVKFQDTAETVWKDQQMWCPLAEGSECKAEARRINEADMWRVVVTHVKTTVTHNYNWQKTLVD